MQALLKVHLEGRTGQPLAMWECAEPHDLYQEEVLDHVVAFLFPTSDTAGCAYLRLAGGVSNRWFAHLEARLPHGVHLPVCLVASARVELFLSSYGVGVLSMAFMPECDTLGMAEAIEFNYRLSQLRWGNAGAFHMVHPTENPQRWERISPEDKQLIPPAPNPDAPLHERLGKPGGTFTPGELLEELLHPLVAFGLRQIQDRLSVYTVVRFGADVDFTSPEARASWAPLLGALVQVEEATHAGAPPDVLGVSHTLLNSRHWVGVSLLGTAHLVADQSPPEHPFNPARVPRVLLKYFMLYLVALLQRHTLHQIIDAAGEIVLSPQQATAPGLAQLRTHLLEFAVTGHFTHVSTREALHRYYRLCQEGMDVRRALDEARQAIADIDAKYTGEQQVHIAEATAQTQENMREHLDTVAHVQKKVEVIEIFLVSVYFAHLWDMLEKTLHTKLPHEPWWAHLLRDWGVLLVAGLAGGIAALYLRPWRRIRHRTASKHSGTAHP